MTTAQSIVSTPKPQKDSLDWLFFPLLKPLWPVLERNRHRRRVRWLPNVLSILRFVIICLVIYKLYLALTEPHGLWIVTMWILIIDLLFLSDGLDGSIARRLRIESDFGRIFDPIADKALVLLLLGVYVLSAHKTLSPPLSWTLITLILIRVAVDLVLVGITAAEAIRKKRPRADGWGKRKLANDGYNAQIITIGLGLAVNGHPSGNLVVAISCLGLVTATCLGLKSIASHWRNLHA